MSDLDKLADAINSQAADLQVIFHRWQKAKLDTARERNMTQMIALATSLRELTSNYDGRGYTAKPFQNQNLVLRLKGEMNLYNIIQTVVMLGLYDNDTFRAECRSYYHDQAAAK